MANAPSPATLGALSKTPPVTGEPMTGASAIVRSLEAAGVDVIFGIPGGAILPTYDPLMESTMRHILVRHEQGSGHAASGYAHVTGRVGTCIATSGPGATNLVTPLADAHMDSIPMVAITGQVGRALVGTDAFQEADTVGITMPVTKHNILVTEADEIPGAIAAAFHIASTGRPGPVLVDITKNAQTDKTTFTWPPKVSLPGYHPVTKPHAKRIAQAAALIATSRRPVLYIGGGVIRADATKELARLVEMSELPVVTTLMALGAFPDTDERHLGMPGMHGTVTAVAALQKADLLIAIGTRFDDRVTGKLSSFAPHAKIIHADIDPAEIGKNRTADVPIVADAGEFLEELIPALEKAFKQYGRADLAPWWRQLNKWRETFPLGYTDTEDGLLAPQHVIKRIGEITGEDGIYVAGVGQHQMWASQFINYDKPRTWLNSGGLGTMGYSIPAAMGAKVGAPDQTVWAIDGDGCFQMTNQELATCVINEIPIKVAIINNSSLGMVRQWQTLFYNERYSNTELNTGSGSMRVPDFVKLAEAYGCVGLRAETMADVDDTIKKAMEIDDQVVVIDFTVSSDAMVWPMVASGVSNDEIQYARGLSPAWDRED